MRITILYLIIQFGFIALLQGQYSAFDTTTYIFKIENSEARLLVEDRDNLHESFFHTLIDTFNTNRGPSPLAYDYYSSGHYLLANASGEHVNVKYITFNNISAIVLPNKRDLLIQVYDSLGQTLPNANVKIGDRNIPFNKKRGGYFKSKWKKEGLVEITAQGETLFYQLQKKDRNWKLLRERYKYFKSGKFGHIVTTPLKLGKRFYYYAKGAIFHKQFTPSVFRNIRYRWNNKRQYKGYVAIQQPVYQPNDTVKVKAYITSHRGKRIKKELNLSLQNVRNRHKTYFNIPIQPDENGNYIHEFALGDSLQLDQNYSLRFSNNKKYRKNSFTQQFHYEDYQLDETTWTFDISKDMYNYGEPVILFAEGKDANGNTIPDGRIKLDLFPGTIQKYYENQIYIPDTLWQFEMPLRARGKTQIIVPDSLLPYLDMEIMAMVELLNYNGEIYKTTKKFKISRNRERIQTEIKNGYVFAEYYKNGKQVDTTGTLEYWFQDEIDAVPEETIRFPFKQKINPFVLDYDFTVGDTYDYITLDTEGQNKVRPDVSISGKWENGVAKFQLNNPHRIPVNFTIRTKDRIVLQDSSTISETIFTKNKHTGAYFITYSYVWGGQVFEKSNELRPYKKQLNIIIKQDSKVRPGDLVNTEVEVKNYKGKAAKGVNLTAGAYNSQFKKANNFSTPQISYKVKRPPFAYTNFSLNQTDLNLGKLPMSRFFYDTMKLKDHFFYKVRYDNPEGLILQYDSLSIPKYAEIAQVAPYIIKHGREVPAEMIYINSKLVYYAGTSVKQPYSFQGFEGKNSITVRTQDAEYKFEDIELKNGHKLEMLANLNSITQSVFKDSMRITKMTNELSLQEKKILNYSLFQLSSGYPNTKYIWQDQSSVYIIPPAGRYTNHVIGPFNSNRVTGYVVQDQFLRNFIFTPGYRFEIGRNQERLYESALFDVSKKYSVPTGRAFHAMGQTVHTKADIVSRTPTQKQFFFGTPNFAHEKNQGNYQFVLAQDTSLIAVVITDSQDSLLRVVKPHVRNLNRIEEGDYHMRLFTRSGYVAKHSFRVKSSHLLCEDLSVLVYQKDSLENTLDSYIISSDASPKRTLDEFTSQFLNKKQQGVIGRISLPSPDTITQIFNVGIYKDNLEVAQTKTDSSGYYQLPCYPGVYQLKINNLSDGSGFEFPIFVTDSSSIRLDLIYFQKAFYLNQIEVIGYRQPLIKQDNTTQGMTVTSKSIRNLPSRNINGLASKSAGITSDGINIRGGRTDGSIYYVDGVAVRGNLIPESEISYVNLPNVITGTVKDSDGEALIGCTVALLLDGEYVAGTITDIDGVYSIRVPDGKFELLVSYIGFESKEISAHSSNNILDIDLEEGNVSLDEVVVVGYGGIKTNSLNFKSLENAPPALEGGVQLRTDFKDYAYWQPNLITDKEGKASFQTVFPDKLTSWRTFVVGMNRKLQAGVAYANTKSFKPLVSQLALPRFLLEGDKSTIVGKSINYTADTYPVETRFLLEDEIIQTNETDVKEALIETTDIQAPINVDSLSITYDLNTGDYGDGEKRQIPIFPNGIEETIGGFHLLEGDTTLQLNFDPQKGPITLYAQSDLLNLMIEDLEYIVDYPYGCNEQTASRLLGLLLKKEVLAKLGKPFEQEDKIVKMITRLKKNQNEDGSWGWWANNLHSNWITIHVLNVLAKAKENGYSTTAFDKGIRFVTNFLPGARPKQQVEILDLLSSIDQATHYDTYLAQLDSLSWGLKEQYTIIKIKQKQKLEYELDSLEAYRRTTLFGGDYWGRKSLDIMSQDVDLGILAFQIYQHEGQRDRLRAIRQFFIMRRSELSTTYGRRYGRNTYETAKILSTLIPNILAQASNGVITANQLTIVGNDSNTITKFPFEQVLHGASTIEVKKQGTGILFFTAFQQFLNKAPTPKKDLFEINTKLVQDGKTIKNLKQGEHVQLIVDIQVDKDTEYALVEIPIPAACSYFSKPNNRRGVEVHREYFRNKTAIFCRKLPAGDHQFTIDLEVRFVGQYTLLPVKLEQMYFPIFYGRNESKMVMVE